MKHIAIVSPLFVPDITPSVHRVRLLCPYFKEFGWDPTVITVHEKYYEGIMDWELTKLLPADLTIIKVKACSVRPVRLVGDVSIRGFIELYRGIKKLHKRKPIDFLYFPIPPYYAALLGPLVWCSLRIRYGIDYIDPWVHEGKSLNRIFSKAWFRDVLASVLEPVTVRYAALVSGISRAYFSDVLKRNSKWERTGITVEFPYGAEKKDHDYIVKNAKVPSLFSASDGYFNMIYAGAILPQSAPFFHALFKAIAHLAAKESERMQRFRFYFVGTGGWSTSVYRHRLGALIQQYQLQKHIREYPTLIPYLDVLRHLHEASAIFILGTTAKHHSPSKIFQVLLSRRPFLAMLNAESTAVEILRESKRGFVLTMNKHEAMDHQEVIGALKGIMHLGCQPDPQGEWELPEQYSARESTRKLTKAMKRLFEPET